MNENADETVRGLRYTQKKYENKVILTGETDVSAMCRDSADLIESLQAQLAESQRRERAAIDFIKSLREDSDGDWGDLVFMIDEWLQENGRGTQEAGKGETE